MISDELLDKRLDELADDLVRGLTWQDAHLFEWEGGSKQEMYGGDENWTHYASIQIYGSSYGPSLDIVVAKDVCWTDDEDSEDEDYYAYSDYALADDLMDLCNDRLQVPDYAVVGFVTMDDGCLWAIWLFDGDPSEQEVGS